MYARMTRSPQLVRRTIGAVALIISLAIVGATLSRIYRNEIWFWSNRADVERRTEALRRTSPANSLLCQTIRYVEPTAYLGGASFSPYSDFVVYDGDIKGPADPHRWGTHLYAGEGCPPTRYLARATRLARHYYFVSTFEE